MPAHVLLDLLLTGTILVTMMHMVHKESLFVRWNIWKASGVRKRGDRSTGIEVASHCG
jgi:hypothetical protein